VLEPVPEVLWCDAGARIGSHVDEDVVVTHVVSEAMKDEDLIEYVVERRLDLGDVHLQDDRAPLRP
jgi:hypothetical protein